MKPMDKRTSVVLNRKPWQEPTLKTVGTLGEVLKGGKSSGGTGDSGEPKKNPQQG